MYEPVNMSLIDDDDDEITNDIPYDPLSIATDGTDGSCAINDQRLVSHHYLSPYS